MRHLTENEKDLLFTALSKNAKDPECSRGRQLELRVLQTKVINNKFVIDEKNGGIE